MTALTQIAPAFVALAHSVVWSTVATVDPDGRPRTRILHPIWEWDGTGLTGWIATMPTPLKREHLAAHPQVSVSYWRPEHDTCSADCDTEWILDDDGRTALWNRFKDAPQPVGYDPAIIDVWSGGPTAPEFAGLRLRPYRLRVVPATMLTAQTGEVLCWSA